VDAAAIAIRMIPPIWRLTWLAANELAISRIVSPGRGTPTLSMSKPTRTTQ